MCGIAGYLAGHATSQDVADRVVVAMTTAIRHRGPDSSGHWLDAEAGIALGMRRLAIMDVSPAGAQPMRSACGRYTMVYNGEIYNHRELRARLEDEGKAPKWMGHSDTEVLLAAISSWGLHRALQAANGMFALALWDRLSRILQLAIDRFGEKPLYYGINGDTFLFGSELKALSKHPSWKGAIDKNSLTQLMRFSYIPAPLSVYKGVSKMMPGTIANVKRTGSSSFEIEHDQYWSTFDMVSKTSSTPAKLTDAEALEQFEALFNDAVKLRMEADVPLGAFLSGGYDSTAVVAQMQRLSSRPVQTFTIGFTEHGYNEAPFARDVAAHLGTDHTELFLTPAEAMGVIPNLPQMYDEPFADSSQIPTFLVSQLARKHVTVALSGDAGDELFGGYNRYFVSNRLLPIWSSVPNWVRTMAAKGIRVVGASAWDQIYRAMTVGKGRALVGDRALKLADLLSAPSPIEGYQQLVSSWNAPERVVPGGIEPNMAMIASHALPADLNFVEQMMYLDLITYLPGDILTKVDRATMAVGLEGRVPFLDHRIAEFAWSLPLDLKVRGGQGKRVIRNFVHSMVPPHLVDRPKSGFGIPIELWLRGALRPWAEDLLADENHELEEFLDLAVVRHHWDQHVSGKRNWQARLWPVLMFASWHRQTRRR